MIYNIEKIKSKEVPNMKKTPEYTRKAIDSYRKKYDLAQIRMPKGTRERIKNYNLSINDIAVSAVLEYLDDLDRRTEDAKKI